MEHLLVTSALCSVLPSPPWLVEQGSGGKIHSPPCHHCIISIPTHPGVTAITSSPVLPLLVALDQRCPASELCWRSGLHSSLLWGLSCVIWDVLHPLHASGIFSSQLWQSKPFSYIAECPLRGKISCGLKPLLWGEKGEKWWEPLSYILSSPFPLRTLALTPLLSEGSGAVVAGLPSVPWGRDRSLAFSSCSHLRVHTFPKTPHFVWGVSFSL